jgi:hypothetical protein
MKRQFEHTKRIGVAHLTIGGNACQRGMVRSPGAHGKLSDAAGVIERSAWGLRGKALIDVVMSVEYHIHIIIVESLPDRLGIGIGASA